jgi:hypothetical protein
MPDKNTRGKMMNSWKIFDDLLETKKPLEIVTDWRM